MSSTWRRTLRSVIPLGTLLIISACGTTPSTGGAAQALPTPTLDYCAPENLPAGIKAVNDLMLQFDDYAVLAQRSQKSQLTQIIPNMQTIRRVAQGAAVPPCLLVLQQNQVAYMDATLNTLLEFQEPDPSTGAIATGIVQAQYYHQSYALELARLIGATLTAPATPAP